MKNSKELFDQQEMFQDGYKEHMFMQIIGILSGLHLYTDEFGFVPLSQLGERLSVSRLEIGPTAIGPKECGCKNLYELVSKLGFKTMEVPMKNGPVNSKVIYISMDWTDDIEIKDGHI